MRHLILAAATPPSPNSSRLNQGKLQSGHLFAKYVLANALLSYLTDCGFINDMTYFLGAAS